MAQNTSGPYDPFTGEVPIEDFNAAMSMGTLARDMLNPITLATMRYRYDPRVWSMSKGVAIPFGGNIFGKSKYGAGMGPRGSFSDAWKTARKTNTGAVWGRRMAAKEALGGEWYFGEGWLKSARAQQVANKSFKDMLYQNAYRGTVGTKLGALQKHKLANVTSNKLYEELDRMGGLDKLNQKTIDEAMSKVGSSKFIQSIGMGTDEWTQYAASKRFAGKNLGRLATKSGATPFLGKLGSTGMKSVATKAAGLGLLALKAGSIIGTASILWDVSKMVGEPIGRYLVENANRVANNFEQRFAPELGGRIAMSYMTTGAATERERAIQAISRSYINGRSALGQEASYLHS